MNKFGSKELYEATRVTDRKVDLMHWFDENESVQREESSDGPYLPLWQTSPFVNVSGLVNYNMVHTTETSEIAANVIKTENAFFGGLNKVAAGTIDDSRPNTAAYAVMQSIKNGHEAAYKGDPFAELYVPIFDSFDMTNRKVVAILLSIIQWEVYLRDILPANVKGIEVVMDYECGGEHENEGADLDRNGQDSSFTFLINGPEVEFIGYGDLHGAFDDWMRYANLITDNLDDGTVNGVKIDSLCAYDIHVFPTQEFYDEIRTATPTIITVSIIIVFAFTIFMFLLYDYLVEKRQKLVLKEATQSNAIVSSLFPKVCHACKGV